MGCRVGMSTDPQDRIKYWKEKEGHTYGQILAMDLTYDQATDREKAEAEMRGCKYGSGGARNGLKTRNGLKNWSVYHVWGGNTD